MNGPCAGCARVGCTVCRVPRYEDGSPVREGDKIRYRQAPGGLMARDPEWKHGTAVSLTDYGCERELYLAHDGRHYLIYSHEIERDES